MIITAQGKYSTTSFKDSKITCEKIIEAYSKYHFKHIDTDGFIQKRMRSNPKNLIITDATAGNGGDTITFARFFKHVNAVEIDKVEFEVLKHNIDRTIFKNYTLINDNYLNIWQDLSQDIIYFDPPWGGPGYKNHESISLKLMDIDLKDIVLSLLKNDNKLIAIKTPHNFALEEFSDALKANFNVAILKHDINKFVLIIVVKI